MFGLQHVHTEGLAAGGQCMHTLQHSDTFVFMQKYDMCIVPVFIVAYIKTIQMEEEISKDIHLNTNLRTNAVALLFTCLLMDGVFKCIIK